MTKYTRTFAFLAVLTVLACASFAASPIAIESVRAHGAAGSFGCTVTGVSTANPGVVTCSAAHGLIDGDMIQVTGVVGATQANITGYAKVTGQSTTTFALYSDAALATSVNVTGTYSSGGKVSQAYDVSGLSGDFTMRININGLTAAKNAVVCLQDSADGFVSDIVSLWCVNPSGGSSSGFYVPPMGYTVRKYQIPSARLGVTNGRFRLSVQSIDGSATVTTSMFIEQ
jgi:hypothetical protein